MRKILLQLTLTAAAIAVVGGLTLARAAPDPPSPAVAPAPDAAPVDPGLAIIQGKCVSCHDTGLIMAVRRPAKDWRDIINQMISRGADLSDSEADQVQAYLEKTMSTAPPTP